MKLIAKNKKAYFDFEIIDTLEAGISLLGSEVKSVKFGRISLKESYVEIKDGEAFLINCNISPYEAANIFNHEPRRQRKLLLHRREIKRWMGKIKETLDWIQGQLKSWEGDEEVKGALEEGASAISQRLEEILGILTLPEGTVGIVEDKTLSTEFGAVYGSLGSSWDAPTQAQMVSLERAERKLAPFMEVLTAFFHEEVPAFHRNMEEAGFSPLGGH